MTQNNSELPFENPWGGRSRINYDQPFMNVVSDMTMLIAPYIVRKLHLYDTRNDAKEIEDELIGEVILHFADELKYWKPKYDLYAFVTLRVRCKLQHILKLSVYSQKKNTVIIDETTPDSSFIPTLRIRKKKTLTKRALIHKEKMIEKEHEDIESVGSMQFFYGDGVH